MNTLVFKALIVIVGFAAQFIDGSLGMGYGVFSASLLVSIGLLPAVASASVHTAEVFTTFVSGISHWRMGNVKPRLVLLLAAPGVVGGILGAYLLSSIPGKTIKPFMALILLGMGILILYRFLIKKDFKVAVQGKESPLELMGLGLVAAFMDAVGGGGWGPIATPSLILKGNHEPRQVVGSVNLVEFVVTVAECLTFIFILGPEKFRWDIVATLLIGGVAAAPLAAISCKKIMPKTLGIMIGGLLVLLNLRTLILAVVH